MCIDTATNMPVSFPDPQQDPHDQCVYHTGTKLQTCLFPNKAQENFFGLLSSGYCRSFDSQNDYGLKAISSAQKQLPCCDH